MLRRGKKRQRSIRTLGLKELRISRNLGIGGLSLRTGLMGDSLREREKGEIKGLSMMRDK